MTTKPKARKFRIRKAPPPAATAEPLQGGWLAALAQEGEASQGIISDHIFDYNRRNGLRQHSSYRFLVTDGGKHSSSLPNSPSLEALAIL